LTAAAAVLRICFYILVEPIGQLISFVFSIPTLSDGGNAEGSIVPQRIVLGIGLTWELVLAKLTMPEKLGR
jgi:hypothetical protein